MRTRVAILGGGAGGITTAFELTATPELREQFEVTVYQRGWRLGGKGASGRNSEHGQRIEEHGLHMWMGFYEHAFDVMRRCYGEWKRTPENPFKVWTDAFKPERQITLQERHADGWVTWDIACPLLPGQPGDGHRFTLAELAVAGFDWLIANFGKSSHPAHQQARQQLRAGREHAAKATVAPQHHAKAVGALNQARETWETAPAPGDDDGRRRAMLIDLGLAVTRGLMVDILPHGEKGFARIDDLEFRDWLAAHGAHADTTWSAPVRSLYTLGFAFAAGKSDFDHASAAAGVTLRVLLDIAFQCKGATLWQMQAGMGDTVFSPFFEVLRDRGVRFEFFHRVTGLELTKTQTFVERIHLSRQVRLRSASYEPLVSVGGLPCWPSEPQWDQIEKGETIARELRRSGLNFESAWCRLPDEEPVTLELGREFDFAVLAIPVGALPSLTPQLCDASDAWAAMTEKVSTVATQAFQLWSSADLGELGWLSGPTVQTTYAEPFDTWAVMSRLLPREEWPPANAPKSLHYFCGALADEIFPPPLDDPTFPLRQAVRVRDGAVAWLDTDAAHLWPRAVGKGPSGGFDWSLLSDASNERGAARFDSQYWRANVDPSERYVLSVPGSTRFRLPPDDSGFATSISPVTGPRRDSRPAASRVPSSRGSSRPGPSAAPKRARPRHRDRR
jgi:uncharacterized protein with NAD-binding domain and iron-sulfur cluster